MQISELRREYQGRALTEADAGPDPLAFFRRWFEEAVECEDHDPNAMVLATAGEDGQPSSRVVLLKGLDERGFVFFTGLTSQKSREMEANPRASLLFYWPTLVRQVRVRGTVARLADAEVAAYFATRPRDSQLGAWASRQSEPIGGRAELEASFDAATQRFGDDADIPVPPHWGGWLLEPSAYEFWQGRPSRLHDRLVYEREGESWRAKRLAP